MGPRGSRQAWRFGLSSLAEPIEPAHVFADPRWADPIKERIRKLNQARAVNEVVGGYKPTQSTLSVPDKQLPPLRVVNGISSTTSSTITTAAKENVQLSSTSPLTPKVTSQIPAGLPGNSTLRWTTGLPVHHENVEDDPAGRDDAESAAQPAPRPLPPRPINPSLATLEKAVAARIYFENLYFPLLRQTPSREQRRLAMEKDMMGMQLSEPQKEYIRERWRKNETDYLRALRRKVDASAFVKLKTIGHGQSLLPWTLGWTSCIIMCHAQEPSASSPSCENARQDSYLR